MQLLSRKEAARLLGVSIKTIDVPTQEQAANNIHHWPPGDGDTGIDRIMPKRQEPRLTSRNGLYYINYHDGQRSGVFLRAQANKKKRRLSLDTGLRKAALK